MNDIKKLNIIKVILLILLVGFIFFICADKDIADKNIREIQGEMGRDNIISSLESCNDRDLLKYYGIPSGNVDGYLFKKAKSPMAVDELLILKLREENQSGAMLDCVYKRIEDQKNNFDGYGVRQTELLSMCKVFAKGKYVFFAVGESADKWEERFNEFMEK
ncbi:MAG: DUF4358 domain-containing protein [Anaerovoracaceae bacterium]